MGPSAKMRAPKTQLQKSRNIPPEGQRAQRRKYESAKKITLYFNRFIPKRKFRHFIENFLRNKTKIIGLIFHFFSTLVFGTLGDPVSGLGTSWNYFCASYSKSSQKLILALV